ncbi:TerB family tellurite resistance protein [Algibacter mikhailovii]|uniref:TerB family tellurite resistance protein n=1 Tax=Algibacter mikhailovii TaxID=425498 RepID=UPI002494FA82|nr:TerB family tellurite resistance protein [Algibacter mikhailovii]
METKKTLKIKFYQNLGKLLYAIAAADKQVREEEFNKFKVLVKEHWEENNDEKENTVYQIVYAFERLHKQEALNAEKYFNDFVNYRNKYPDLFTEAIRKRIMKTASSVALSFSKVNKSELIMLAKLDMALKK